MEIVLEEPFPGRLYASYFYPSGVNSRQSTARMEPMMLFWREQLTQKAKAVVEQVPPRIPVEMHQVVDHVPATFEGALLLQIAGDVGTQVGL